MKTIDKTIRFPDVSAIVLGDIATAVRKPEIGIHAERNNDSIRFRCPQGWEGQIERVIRVRIDQYRKLKADVGAFVESEREKLADL